jgi:hypothetical protein
MKRYISGLVLLILAGIVAAYAEKPPTVANPYKPLSGVPNANVVGTVQTVFETIGVTGKQINEIAYLALLEAAKKEHSGNIDIVDITWVFVKKNKATKRNQFSANGKVVSFGSGNQRQAATGVEGALARAVGDVSKDFSPRTRIAIVQITAPDRSTRDFIIGELEYILQQQGYYIVDRAQLDRIFEEQRFGTSGDVDDNTAARMGKIAGANVVITGRVDGEGNLRRLRLRALNTESAQVLGTAPERL